MPENLFSGVRHTISMGFTTMDESSPSEWNDLDIRSSHDDVEMALEDYLRKVFGPEVVINHEDDRIYVDEPTLPEGMLRRHYRFKAS